VVVNELVVVLVIEVVVVLVVELPAGPGEV
jgi:hypothetical protein